MFDAPLLTPHGFCLAWDPALLELHVISDAVIALSYYSIPLALGYFVLRRRDLAFSWVFILFAVFILACGTTHVLDIWTLWHADYVTQGLVKAFTAVASVLTACLLWPLIPKALLLPSPSVLRRANEQLTEEIHTREVAVSALKRETADRERTEAMLRQSQKMEAIGQLTGGVAHDFNNLLMVIQGNLEALQRRLPGDTDSERYIGRALRSVQQGSTLTGQLLAFSRQQPLEPAVFDLNDRVTALVDLLPGTLRPGSPVELELSLAPDLLPVQADPNHLENALLNLVINARDAMPAGGTLRITTRNVTVDKAAAGSLDAEPGEYATVSVADTGTGMTDEVREMAFEPFFTTKPVGSGSGLGLSQIYGFVRQSQGYVTLDSVLGEGTTVTIYLRRAEASGATPPRTPIPGG
jgi:signal transduction histidine kinase